MTPQVTEWPVPGACTLRRGLELYFERNGFSSAAYTASHTPAVFRHITIQVPNTPRHAWAIRLHDLHHVLTGYGTDTAGECEISAWEARCGLRPLGLYVGGIVTSLALLGAVRYPRRTWAASRCSRRGPSLYHEPFGDYASLLDRRVGDVRQALAIPPSGLAGPTAGLHHGAPTSPGAR